MVRKPKQRVQLFSDYENFVYLMAELELLIESGTIEWSVGTANATKHRMNCGEKGPHHWPDRE